MLKFIDFACPNKMLILLSTNTCESVSMQICISQVFCLLTIIMETQSRVQNKASLGYLLSALQKITCRDKSPLLSLPFFLSQSNTPWQWLNHPVPLLWGSTLFNPLRGRSLCERMLCKHCGSLMWELLGKRAGAGVMESPSPWEQWAFRM